MAFIEKCFCCNLQIACGFFAAYLLIAYLIAFAFELIWIILESSKGVPLIGIFLSIEYFTLILFAAILLHGLATKNTLCLVLWMFAVTIFAIPEAGLVIRISTHFWGIFHIYGITELSCWLIRIIVNVIEIILVQSLYSIWKDDDLLDKRIQELNGISVIADTHQNNSQFYQNNNNNNAGYDEQNNHHHSVIIDDQLDGGSLKRYGSIPHLWNNFQNMMMIHPHHHCGGDDHHQQIINNYYHLNNNNNNSSCSEFNASSYVPSSASASALEFYDLAKKSHSLMDLRFLDEWSTEPSFNNKAWSEINFTSSMNNNNNNNNLSRCKSMDQIIISEKKPEKDEASNQIIKNRSGFYASKIQNYGVPIYYGPLDGPDFLIYKKQLERLNSRNSLSNNSADEISKYRDVAL